MECQGTEQGTGTEAQGMLPGVARRGTMPREPGLAPGTRGTPGKGPRRDRDPVGLGRRGHCQGHPSKRGDPVGTLHEGSLLQKGPRGALEEGPKGHLGSDLIVRGGPIERETPRGRAGGSQCQGDPKGHRGCGVTL